MRAGSPFLLFHYEIGSFSSHYLPNYSNSKQLLACSFIFCNAAVTNIDFCRFDSTLTHERTTFMLSLYNLQEKLENNRIRNNGT